MPFGLQTAGLFCRLAFDRLRHRHELSVEQRLAMLPLAGAPLAHAVTISWNDRQVPFIEAETDEDLAVALGVVHGHLRLTQIDFMRRLAQGRIAEVLGDRGLGIDRLVRTFGIARAVPQILATMPSKTRDWLEHFVEGLNHTIDHLPGLPREYSLLKMSPARFCVSEIVTLARLIAADVNWLIWMRLLKYRDDPEWPRLWRRLLRHDLLSVGSETDAGALSGITDEVSGRILRSGSNSVAIAGNRSATGGALIASDPHLSIGLPNSWLLAGMKSPSLHAVGLMIPGVPLVAIGRNPWIAWGGTSLHAASSELVAIPAGTELSQRLEPISIRGGKNVSLRIRESPWGPIVSDLPQLRSGTRTFALRWIGHEPSDEFTAMLRVGAARSCDDFRAAFRDYAVPGLEMIFADIHGAIGQIMAARLPEWSTPEPDDIVSSPDPGWKRRLQSADLPSRFDPDQGWLASANARPTARLPVVGFHFSPPHRLRRLQYLLGRGPKLSLSDLMQVQSDVHLAEASAQRDLLLAWLREIQHGSRTRVLHQQLKSWDGNYDLQSPGALAFELLFYHLARELVRPRKHAAYDASWGTRILLWEDIQATEADVRRKALTRATRKAARDYGKAKNWGGIHRLVLAHPLGMLPIVGRRYRFADFPASGVSETLMKTAHGLTNRRHRTNYGSVARHISDLSDPDANYFALLGGQDGWLDSTSFTDQVPLWRRSEYVQVPLLPESVQKTFRHRTVLVPSRRP